MSVKIRTLYLYLLPDMSIYLYFMNAIDKILYLQKWFASLNGYLKSYLVIKNQLNTL